jgi:hypothetical protein
MTPMEEVWRGVQGWERLYEVSDQGRVRSLDRVVSKPNWGTFIRKGKILKPGVNKGYQTVTLQDRSHSRIERRLIHQVVLTAFVGPCPTGMETRHLDGNRSNNRATNLAWGTRVQNAADRDHHGNMRRSLNRGECAHGHKWTKDTLKLDPRGRVYCKECRRQYATKYRKQKAERK